MQRSAHSSAAWGLGLAACFCNLMIILVPFGIPLGIAALLLGLFGRDRRSGRNVPALALSGVSFVIAAIWVFTIAAVLLVDPTIV